MAKLRHEIEYLFTRLGMGLARSLSMPTADRFGAALGSLTHMLLGSRRRIARDNLRQAFGSAFSEDQIDALVRAVFRNTGRSLIDFSRMSTILEYGIDRLCVSDGLDNIEEAHRRGKGIIAVSAHFGSHELFGAWIASRGIPTDIIVGIQHNEKVDRLINGWRKQLGVGLIRVDTGIRDVFRSLKDNHIVAMLADQHAPNGIPIEFFGRKAAVAKGPAVFSLRSGAPILPFMLHRERFDRHIIEAGQPIYPPESGNNEEKIVRITEAYTAFIEDRIRAYPEQWLWTHRRWKI
ncbi:MAG TPA: lysophospholipid acyltransferase family protein [candidate division Zixibacteria bacterium]|nr:lysophospholipid acyltransferase family protein [candidate division Zixibacteria bacterium]